MFDRCYDNDIYRKDVNIDIDFDQEITMQNAMMANQSVGGAMPMKPMMAPYSNYAVQSGCGAQPIIEPMQEKVVHREIVHEVPHICPQNTKVINHHVYKHTYMSQPTCCEENVVSHVQEGSCCNFR